MSIGSFDHPALSLAKRLVNPVVVFLSLFFAVEMTAPPFSGPELILGSLAFLIAAEVFDGYEFFEIEVVGWVRAARYVTDLLVAWLLVFGLLSFLGFAAGQLKAVNQVTIVVWFILTPILLFLAQSFVRAYLESIRKGGELRTAVVVGANTLALKLTKQIHDQRSLMIRVVGFFDDRVDERCDPALLALLTGGITDVGAYVTQHNIDLVYITLPIMNQPRIHQLVNSLRNTTCSVYFVPDIFIFDLVQARLVYINNIPVIGVFESPLTGINAVHKRIFDVLASGVILLLISPILLSIALGVKLTSQGPIFFKQRRYGIDGDEILVYKFRSMRVMDNGDEVVQATKNDARVTPFGAFIRKTSLDELPQLINVLEGKMSIVGPRPHAVAHNEHYRKLIHGYMWRHKVKPGITGLAQVSGFRGETDTIDKMEGRVQHDIAYLKNWSLLLDVLIILKTLRLVFKDSQAY